MVDKNKDYPLSPEEFWAIYKKVPRLCVEVVLKSSKGVYLTKRSIEPCKGQWHLPGGTVFFGERLAEAVERIAKRELGITVTGTKLLGYIDYPGHYEHGLDSPVGIAFLVDYKGAIKANDKEAADAGWFHKPPVNMHADQGEFIIDKIL